MRLVSTVAGGNARRGTTLQISEIRFSSTESTKLRVIASVKRRSTGDKLSQLGEVRAKGAERELSIKISPSSIIGDGEILVAQVYRHHRLLLDERLLKEEFSFRALLKYCSGESKSKVYEILNKRGITIRAKLGAVSNPALETGNKADDVSQRVNADQSPSPSVLSILAPAMDTNGNSDSAQGSRCQDRVRQSRIHHIQSICSPESRATSGEHYRICSVYCTHRRNSVRISQGIQGS
ncbi:hypothetical protein DFH08DRAFT_838482 [Mycena albidolilacea]|uniref:Uncharacterized protein n=1 Tax=Mycena albidolilacea TaxID=1033008 RepID=A0AAD7F200_9AGAR|nr:hypothetical protein DFH08DRAFT_838482 [Mycena albidolilacea]